MAQAREVEILEEFRRRVASGELDRVAVAFRVPVDVPDRRHATEELRVEAGVSVHAEADRADGPPAEVDATLEREETETVLREVADVVGELVPRSEARFLPDSAVGSVRIEVEDEQVDLFFLTDEDQRSEQNAPLSPQAVEAIDDLTQLHHRMLED